MTCSGLFGAPEISQTPSLITSKIEESDCGELSQKTEVEPPTAEACRAGDMVPPHVPTYICV